MDKNQSLKLASFIFGLVALLHLIRLLLNWEANINGFNVPVWISYIAVIVAGYLSWSMYSVSKK